ncbi:hypothetical protein [Pedobacter punctiformis]|uniref:DUF4468 domain-containing protein n=1 Tax=Pedobacter punctiformis TaxID=3004097 RepID=A0ABT4LEX1_9SPHI|nr:hypothetical protein [Pedobacter sp. HCMS5-2]MCZ4245718.1 hypothetical protein [Pedobacter sp. HCMS5-2]
MKITLLAGMIYCLGFFQQDEPLSKVANIELPQRAERINKNEINNNTKRKFKSTYVISQFDQLYKVDEVLFGFEDYKVQKDDFRTLEDRKNEWLGAMYENNSNPNKNVERAEIIKVNNTKFLIMTALRNDEYFCSFISDKKGSRGISGSLQYKAVDKGNAEKLLNTILNRLIFKAPSLSNDN